MTVERDQHVIGLNSGVRGGSAWDHILGNRGRFRLRPLQPHLQIPASSRAWRRLARCGRCGRCGRRAQFVVLHLGEAGEVALRVLLQIGLDLGGILRILHRIPISEFEGCRVVTGRRRCRRCHRDCGCCGGVAQHGMEIEITLQGGLRPRHLFVPGLRAYPGRRLLEHLFDGRSRLRDGLDQFPGEQPIAAGSAVLGRLAGACGIGDEGAGGRVHAGQAAGGRAAFLRQWIVAARVQHHDVQSVVGFTHGAQHLAGIHRFGLQIRFAVDVRINRYEIIFAVGLDAVSGVIEEPHRVRGGRDLRREGVDRRIQAAPLRVDFDCGLEAGSPECLIHLPGIVGGVVQGTNFDISIVADDQCNPAFGGCGCAGHGAHQYHQSAKPPAHFDPAFCLFKPTVRQIAPPANLFPAAGSPWLRIRAA